MTQTSIPALRELHNQASNLFLAIHAAMDAVKNDDGPEQTAEWSELHTISKSAAVTGDLLSAMIRRAEEADEPVPYTVPDDLDLHQPTGHWDGGTFSIGNYAGGEKPW